MYKKMNICVIGAGLSGLVAGYGLSKKGHKVTVIEKETRIGGLARSFDQNGDKIPIVYHHIMRCDSATRNLIKELGLWDNFFKRKTKMGFYSNKKIHKLSGPLDILGFKPLSFASRLKFLLFGLRVKMRRDWEELENTTAKEWIIRKANREIYQKMFEPLLKIKFSDDSDNISARWVGERLNMGESSGPFGYLKGGIEQILDELASQIRKRGGNIRLGSEFVKFNISRGKIESVIFKESGKERMMKADKVIYTGPVSHLAKSAKFPGWYEKKLKGIKYKSTICAAIGIDKDISEFYWTNFIAGNFSFGGIINHCKLNPYIKSAKSMLYVFIYLNKSDRLWKESDSKILEKFISEMDGVFGIKGGVKWKHLFRVEHSKPVYDINYRENMLDYSTPIGNLYIGGIALFYPKIRNMGAAIKTGKDLVGIVDNDSTKV